MREKYKELIQILILLAVLLLCMLLYQKLPPFKGSTPFNAPEWQERQ